eukprot:GHVO01021330.1.p1 GENE.GHVO01021330.1~~GHVO01021330.1.p1  ORF type:complete len:521 (+),score=38.72 GHVO01021330.1:105-1667(+)
MAAVKYTVPVSAASGLQDAQFDGVVVISDSAEHLQGDTLSSIYSAVSSHKKIDNSESDVVVLSCPGVPSGRLVYCPTGPVTRDYDDVRSFGEAAVRAVKRAISAGCRKPLVVGLNHERYSLSARVTILGALDALYTPLEVRESCPDRASKADQVGVLLPGLKDSDLEVKILHALTVGRTVYKDIGGSDPERSAPPAVADYVTEIFKSTCIKVNVISDCSVLEQEYPLMAAVNRASKVVPRHHARLIFLEYVGEGTIDSTLMLVGKGVTYDTGGADLKVGGAMAGMSRDKCGAAFVAGFFQTLSMLKPKGIKVMGAMCMVRNSIGSDCYVSDEIITSRAGVRCRIGNTDAEGRMAMGDVLCHMKEKAANEINPQIFTIATLTGHVIRAYSEAYSAVVPNGPAKEKGIPDLLFKSGEKSGEPFEISTLRREDYALHEAKSEYADCIQANTKPSTMTNRGHQTPAAFLSMASGLAQHGCDSSAPLPYAHLDIAGSAGSFPQPPTGAPLVAMAHAYLLDRPLQA